LPASREAARDRLGMLQVPYSADSFVKQAGEGDTIAIKTFLAAGMNVNARNEKGFTALIKATEMGHTETVQSLLAAGADPNLDNFESHYSALMMAAYKGDVPTMKVLIAGGADVNLQFRPNEDNALFAAADLWPARRGRVSSRQQGFHRCQKPVARNASSCISVPGG
jgi:ankyrin repeat protein